MNLSEITYCPFCFNKLNKFLDRMECTIRDADSSGYSEFTVYVYSSDYSYEFYAWHNGFVAYYISRSGKFCVSLAEDRTVIYSENYDKSFSEAMNFFKTTFLDNHFFA